MPAGAWPMLKTLSWPAVICICTSVLSAMALMSQLILMSYHGNDTASAGQQFSDHNVKAVAANLDPDIMTSLPEKFLPEYKTPCWYQTKPAARQQARGSTDQEGQLLSAGVQQQQLLLAGQQDPVQLQCLPYFHILGSFQSGAFSLYNMIALHPAVTKGHNPRPHFWAEYDKTFSVYMSELQGAMTLIQQQPSSAVLGDASESTFAYYMAAGMRGHRIWQQTVQPCFARCEKLQGEFKHRCMDVCWWNATNTDNKNAQQLGVQPRWRLDTPLLMKAAYSRAPVAAVPKLVVVLREPGQRLLSAFLEYSHYKAKYGSHARGFLAFVKEQLSAFQACVDKYSSVEECTLLFESLDYTNEQVYFHCDQVLRGLYWVYLEGWRRHFGPNQLLVVFAEELFTSPQTVLQRVIRFLGLSQNVSAAGLDGGVNNQKAAAATAAEEALQDENVWSAMLRAAGPRVSLTAQHNYYSEVPEAKQLVDAFYEVHNRRLGQLLLGRAVSPWENLHAAVGALSL